jgi:hypothetical protein
MSFFFLLSFFFYKIKEQEGGTRPVQGRAVGGLIAGGRERVAGKRIGR